MKVPYTVNWLVVGGFMGFTDLKVSTRVEVFSPAQKTSMIVPFEFLATLEC
jgi:hypothetical protein